jgi:hypothetical protein
MRTLRFTPLVLGASLLLVAPGSLPCLASPDDQTALDPARVEVETINPQASAHGKYRTLLRRIRCPEDRAAYHDFNDYGMYTGTAWHNYTNLPPGYWVYVYPDWYIWQDGPRTPVQAAPVPGGKIMIGPGLKPAPGNLGLPR